MKIKMEMKKFTRVMVALLTLTTFFVACGGDDSDSDNGGGPSSGGTSIMTSEQQKSKMETIAKEFMSYFKASNFQNVVDITKYANETYNDDNYNSDAVNRWWSDCLDAITELNGVSGYSKNYIRLYIASNFVGHFNANTSTKKWEYTSASDLQFTFKDKKGNTCTATLSTSGEKKKVYVGDSFDYNWDNYTSETDEYRYKNYIMVPENINVTFTQSGTTIASIVVTTELSGMSSVDYDLSKDSYSATCKMTVNDYTFNTSKVAYSPSSASVSLTVSKGSKTLISMSVSASGSVTNDQVEEGNISNVGTVNINMDILGELQVKGTCSSCSKFKSYMEKADANDNNESTYKSYILQANSLLDIGLYYDNSNTKQASVFLEPFQQDDYYERNWYCEPVLKFSDGTTYSTFEAFFDETSFQDVIDKFNALIDEYTDMVD